MEAQDLELLEKYASADPELKTLWEEHMLYEKQLEKLEAKPFKTPAEIPPYVSGRCPRGGFPARGLFFSQRLCLWRGVEAGLDRQRCGRQRAMRLRPPPASREAEPSGSEAARRLKPVVNAC